VEINQPPLALKLIASNKARVLIRIDTVVNNKFIEVVGG
jgi:hypothetical protein